MEEYPKGPVSWMARNSVAANLLMIVFIIGGLLVASRLKQEVFPEFELDVVRVQVEYPGASPEEVEEGIVLAIEDEVRSLDGVKKVTSTSYEGNGIVSVELLTDVNKSSVLQDVKNAVDKIQSFPEDSERPIVSLLEPRREVISLILYGDLSRRTLRDLAERLRDDLIQIEGITLVELAAVPDLEIAVEIPRNTLRAYNLTLDQVSQLINRTAFDLPAGGLKTGAGEVLVRTKERRDYAKDFGNIPVVVSPDGSRVELKDIATISEVLEETDTEAYFNGLPATRVDVYRVANQNPIDISQKVRTFMSEFEMGLPEGVSVAAWNDRSEIYRERIDLLLRNATLGLILVLIILGMFLEPKLAFWVTLGIPISIIGSFLLIPWTDASINMISLFAFIVTLGIIVDDAILVGENIYYMREKGMSFLEASIKGARQITSPVCFAVLTNIAAFTPLFFVPGTTGKLFLQIPAIVVSVFLISLIESLFILPAHLAHPHNGRKFWKIVSIPSKYFEGLLKQFIEKLFVPSLKVSLKNRYLTLTIGTCFLAVVAGLYVGGRIELSYLPRVDSDIASAQVLLPYGVPIETSREVQAKLVEGAKELIKRQNKDISKGIYTQIGEALPILGPANAALQVTGSHNVGAQVFLVPSDQRNISGVEFAKEWREIVGSLPTAETTKFSGTIETGWGPPIQIDLSHYSKDVLEAAAKELGRKLQNYAGLSDIDDGVSLGKPQYSLKIKPEARGLGITAEDMARQVRNAFYGAEALRQVRGRNEYKVKVRLPKNERETLHTVEDLIIRTPQGGEIPLTEAAEIIQDRAYTNIRRTNAQRVLAITADVDENRTNANKVIENVKEAVLPELIANYPGLQYSLEGEQREQEEALQSLAIGFIFAMVVIYAMLAIPFKSYIQPLIVMLSIPFGVIGAVLGHLLLGYELSIISMFGIVALSGVVVNDSLVLVVTTNENKRAKQMGVFDAIVEGASRRFRPIVLTSLTTFMGLSPMIFETSMQARFLIPMAISLGFGVLFATLITLYITTSVYMILEDMKSLPVQGTRR